MLVLLAVLLLTLLRPLRRRFGFAKLVFGLALLFALAASNAGESALANQACLLAAAVAVYWGLRSFARSTLRT